MSDEEVIRLNPSRVIPPALVVLVMGGFALSQESWVLRLSGAAFLVGTAVYLARASLWRLTIRSDSVEVRSLKGTLTFTKGHSDVERRRVAAGLTGTGTVLVLKDRASHGRIAVSLLDFRGRDRDEVESKIRHALGRR